MSELQSVETALFAFKKRDKRLVLTRAAIAYVVCSLLLAAAFLAATWPLWGGLIRWYLSILGTLRAGGTPPPPPIEQFRPLLLWLLPLYPLSFVLLAAFEAACLRWLVRGESGGGFFGLTLGADTWRVWATYWLWLLFFVVFGVAVACVYVGLRALGAIAGPLHILVLLLAALTPLALIAALIFLSVRLAPAAALTVARKRVSFFAVWGQTRGRFWALLGAFVLVMVGYFVVSTVASQLFQIPINGVLMPALARAEHGGDVGAVLADLQQAFTAPGFVALWVIYILFTHALMLAFYIALYGVNARAVEAEATAAPAAASP